VSRHLRLAHFSPLPPARTGIADYSAELLPHLGRLAEVTLFSEQYDALDGTDLAAFPAFPVAAFGAQRWEHDLAFYHMGNSLYHVEIARSLARYPGIMVLHDFGLHQLCAGQSLAGGKSALYRREMAYALGARGLSWAREVEMGMCEPPHFEVALNDRYLEVALGVLVHSRYARDLARQRVPWQEIGVVPAPIGLAQAASFRHRLNLPREAVIFGSFGLVSHTKELERVLLAFREVRRHVPDAHYLIVGEWQSHDVDVPAVVARLDLADAVTSIGFAPSLSDFLSWLATVDVVVNLRYPTVGETSATALRGLATGRPLIVNDHGWYRELPDTVCLKVAPQDDQALVDAMLLLARDPGLRREMGQQARTYAQEQHSPERAAAAYVAFAEHVLGCCTGRNRA